MSLCLSSWGRDTLISLTLVSDSKRTTRLLTCTWEGTLRSSKTSSASHSSGAASKYPSWSALHRCLPTGGQGSLRRPCDLGQGQEAEAGIRDAGAWGGHCLQQGRAGDMVSKVASTSAGRGQGGTLTLRAQMGRASLTPPALLPDSMGSLGVRTEPQTVQPGGMTSGLLYPPSQPHVGKRYPPLPPFLSALPSEPCSSSRFSSPCGTSHNPPKILVFALCMCLARRSLATGVA